MSAEKVLITSLTVTPLEIYLIPQVLRMRLLNLCSCKALPLHHRLYHWKEAFLWDVPACTKQLPEQWEWLWTLNYTVFCCRLNFCSVLKAQYSSSEQHWQLCAAAAMAFPSEAWMTVDPHCESFRSSILPLFTVHQEKVGYTVVRRVSTSCINGTSFQASSMCLWLPQNSNYFSSKGPSWSTVLNFFGFIACFAE